LSQSLIVAGITFLVAFATGYPLLWALRRYRVGKQIRVEGPDAHLQKMGTPTMGGILIWLSVFVATAIFNVLGAYSIIVPMITTAATGLLGTLDDVLGLMGDSAEGLTARAKMAGLTIISIGVALVAYKVLDVNYIFVPFIRNPIVIDFWLVPLAALAVVGTANAVNLTDGLDSLAGMCASVSFTAYGIIAYVQGQGPLATFCFTVVGALLGFLWFNAYPAQLFMGDTGSLSLGATLATVAIMTGHILLLPIIGFVFVAEAGSVILQVLYFKVSGGKRLFRMSPLHHHFELLGWSETHVSQRFWLLSIVSGMIGIALAFL
jgi:phospho-N-acetylmuramoyl-pentapeptide-transferase